MSKIDFKKIVKSPAPVLRVALGSTLKRSPKAEITTLNNGCKCLVNICNYDEVMRLAHLYELTAVVLKRANVFEKWRVHKIAKKPLAYKSSDYSHRHLLYKEVHYGHFSDEREFVSKFVTSEFQNNSLKNLSDLDDLYRDIKTLWSAYENLKPKEFILLSKLKERYGAWWRYCRTLPITCVAKKVKETYFKIGLLEKKV